MLQNKKILISIIVGVIVIIAIIGAVIIIAEREEISNNVVIEKENEVDLEKLEMDFRNSFSQMEYTENKEEGAVYVVYQLEQKEENMYDVNVKLPQISAETEVTKEINNKIVNTYGKKLLDILQGSEEYTLYNVEYVTYINENILSLVIKGTLKEGSNPQRVTLETYNYDMEKDEIVNLEEMLELKQIEKSDLQAKIVETIRQKNVNAEVVAKQGYNIYVRDIRSDEYLIENITTYFLGDDGYLYIVFAYGNINFTETMDIIIL